VLDDRKEYANTHRFLSADVIVPENFIKVFEGLDITSGSYIIIVTPDHNNDRDVLREALKTDAGYIGMIGSTRKRNTIFQSLVSEGIGEDDLKRVYCPIGIDIGSESPQEIAISIVAELISVRRGKTNRAK
jgi:xanthine dehydrogenase accessory factor